MALPPDHLEGQIGHDAGQPDRRGHVVVDADHVRAQAGIVGDRAVRVAAAGGRGIPIEIGHGKIPLNSPDTAGPDGRPGSGGRHRRRM